MFSKLVSLPVILLIFTSCAAQNLKSNLSSSYTNFEADTQLKYASNSITILDVKTGSVVFSKNENTALAPASTLKTITSTTALNLLGKNYQWETSLGYSGKITADSILNGDLIIKGSGDPTLGSDRYDQTKSSVILQRWLVAVNKAGIEKITGRVLVDDLTFGTQTIPEGWIWQDIGNYYGAGSSSLNWNENQFDFYFEPGAKIGDPVKIIKMNPVPAEVKIVNEVTTGELGSGDNVYAFSSPFSGIIYIRGTYGKDLKKTISASLPDPAFQAANALQNYLVKNGVTISNNPATTRMAVAQNINTNSAFVVIDTYNSPSLSEVVYWLNKKSINLYAECMLKTIAKSSDKQISTINGAETVKEFWSKKAGLDKRAINIIDGSGLSPEDRVTTMSIARVLQSARKETWFGEFLASLPENNGMKLKSGSLRNVLAYAGYFTNSKGQEFAISFIVNNYNGSTSAIKQKMFKVLDELK